MVDDVQLTKNFRLSEFVRVSHRELTALEEQRAREHATLHLQPARREKGRLVITSYIRTPPNVGGGTHADGSAVDIVPLDTTLDDLFSWYQLHPWAYGQVIHEGDHLHVTLPGTRGKVGEVLVMDSAGSFHYGMGYLPVVPALALISAMFLIWAIL